jgi:hypothetical protein
MNPHSSNAEDEDGSRRLLLFFNVKQTGFSFFGKVCSGKRRESAAELRLSGQGITAKWEALG